MTHRALTVIAWLAGYITYLGVINTVMGGSRTIMVTAVIICALALIVRGAIESTGARNEP